MGSVTTVTRQNADGKKVTVFRAYVRRTKGDANVSKSKVFKTKTEAKQWIKDNENTKAIAAALSGSKAGDFVTLVELFVKAPPTEGTRYWAASHLDFWKTELGHMNVAEISRGVINAAKAKLQEKRAFRHTPNGPKEMADVVTPATVNRYLASLSSVFNYARDRGIIDVHPMKAGAVKKLGEGNNARSRILTAEEESKLYAAADASTWPMMRMFLRVCLTTGGRKSEVLNLRWKDINLDDSVAVLLDTKNGTSRSLPLVSDVKVSLAEAKKVRPLKGDYVFFDPKHPMRPKNVDTIWKFVRQRAGLLKDRESRLEQVVLHSTRHTVATKLLKNGANLVQVANITGHKTLAMLKRYEHLAAQDAVALAEKVFAEGGPL